jgi:CRISPR system Cascade subunit CasD
MISTQAVLVLRLEGPMQSWGLRSRWDVRDTGTEPSKSGVLGILGCALGWKRGDPRFMELSSQIQIAVREESPGVVMNDFQTITGLNRQADGKLKKATAGKHREITIIVSPREYLSDARFLVLIQGPEKIINACAEALKNPVWPVYLGRKSCVPTRPVFSEILKTTQNLRELIQQIPWEYIPTIRSESTIPTHLRCIVECPTGDTFRVDEYLANPMHMYGTRAVEVFFIPRPSKTGNESPEMNIKQEDV